MVIVRKFKERIKEIMEKLLVIADHEFDPRLRRKISWMAENFSEIYLCSDCRGEWVKKNDFSKSYKIIDYCDDKKLSEFSDGLCYVSGAKILVEKRKILQLLSKKNTVIIEIPDLPLRSRFGFINKIKLLIFKRLLKGICDYGVITSDKFSDYLPKNIKYFFSENILDFTIATELSKLEQTYVSDGPMNIAFVGAFRYEEQLRMIIRYALKRPGLVKLHFYGGPVEIVRKLVRLENFGENGCFDGDNIHIYGPYIFEEDIVSIYNKIDMLFSVYDARQMNVKLAIPNKLYEAGLSKRWLLCANNTHLSEIVMENKIGCSLPYLLRDFCAFEEQLDNFISYVKGGVIFPEEFALRVLDKSRKQRIEFLNFIKNCSPV